MYLHTHCAPTPRTPPHPFPSPDFKHQSFVVLCSALRTGKCIWQIVKRQKKKRTNKTTKYTLFKITTERRWCCCCSVRLSRWMESLCYCYSVIENFRKRAESCVHYRTVWWSGWVTHKYQCTLSALTRSKLYTISFLPSEGCYYEEHITSMGYVYVASRKNTCCAVLIVKFDPNRAKSILLAFIVLNAWAYCVTIYAFSCVSKNIFKWVLRLVYNVQLQTVNIKTYKQ